MHISVLHDAEQQDSSHYSVGERHLLLPPKRIPDRTQAPISAVACEATLIGLPVELQEQILQLSLDSIQPSNDRVFDVYDLYCLSDVNRHLHNVMHNLVQLEMKKCHRQADARLAQMEDCNTMLAILQEQRYMIYSREAFLVRGDAIIEGYDTASKSFGGLGKKATVYEQWTAAPAYKAGRKRPQSPRCVKCLESWKGFAVLVGVLLVVLIILSGLAIRAALRENDTCVHIMAGHDAIGSHLLIQDHLAGHAYRPWLSVI
jgi:hypothetical protein